MSDEGAAAYPSSETELREMEGGVGQRFAVMDPQSDNPALPVSTLRKVETGRGVDEEVQHEISRRGAFSYDPIVRLQRTSVTKLRPNYICVRIREEVTSRIVE